MKVLLILDHPSHKIQFNALGKIKNNYLEEVKSEQKQAEAGEE